MVRSPAATANSASSKAFAACAKLAPSGFGGHFAGGPGGSFKPSAAEQQALTTYEQCMSGHGVPIAAGSTFQTIQSLIKEDPSAATANKACASDLQGRLLTAPFVRFGLRLRRVGLTGPRPTRPRPASVGDDGLRAGPTTDRLPGAVPARRQGTESHPVALVLLGHCPRQTARTGTRGAPRTGGG